MPIMDKISEAEKNVAEMKEKALKQGQEEYVMKIDAANMQAKQIEEDTLKKIGAIEEETNELILQEKGKVEQALDEETKKLVDAASNNQAKAVEIILERIME